MYLIGLAKPVAETVTKFSGEGREIANDGTGVHLVARLVKSRTTGRGAPLLKFCEVYPSLG